MSILHIRLHYCRVQAKISLYLRPKQFFKMISRRNIRVKVMQTIYSVETVGAESDMVKAKALLKKKIDDSARLFSYLVFLITEVARYAETDSLKRSSKHLPTEQDLQVNTKIAGNTLLWQILEDSSFQMTAEEDKFSLLCDTELIRKLYIELTESEAYQRYTGLQSRGKNDERDILVHIVNDLMFPSEDLTGHLEEHFLHWDDDAEMMQQMLMNFLHKPASYNFRQIVSQEKRTFAMNLLTTAIEKKDYCLELIKPRLKNWDADRIAQLDMIIMRLGVCELLYFETIPAKVTINEYIDLAKEYSTPQSGQFVNGLLDNIHKEIEQQGNLNKVDYKK